MKKFLPAFVVLLATALPAAAAWMPHYKMDSFAWLADAIVYCNEKELQVKEVRPPDLSGFPEIKTLVQCEVLESYKGKLPKGSLQTIEFDSVFSRRKIFKGNTTIVDRSQGTVRKIPAEYLPAGKSLIFLKKKGDAFQPITAKLVQKDAVYQFCQCESNPGPFILVEQKPENITLKSGEKYGEKALLEDFSLALKKASSLQQPVPIPPPIGNP